MLLNPESLFSETSMTPSVLRKENKPRIKILKSVIAGSENQGIIQIENPLHSPNQIIRVNDQATSS